MNKEQREKVTEILSSIVPAPDAICKSKLRANGVYDDTYEEAMILLELSKLLSWSDVQMILDLKQAAVENNIERSKNFIKDSGE